MKKLGLIALAAFFAVALSSCERPSKPETVAPEGVETTTPAANPEATPATPATPAEEVKPAEAATATDASTAPAQ